MKVQKFVPISVILSLILLTVSLVAAQESNHSRSFLTEDQSIAGGIIPDDTIVVAIAQEPDSLYLYGTSMLAALHVMQAFMDGPIDTLDYDYQPVILTKIPKLDDGDAIINAIEVNTNDTVQNINGEVVTLIPGETIIDSNGNVVVFNGTPVLMNQIEVTYSLKSNIYWSDGVLLTAADSVFSQQVDCHPDTPTSKFVCDRTASYANPNNQTAVWIGIPGFMSSTYSTNFWTPLPNHILGSTPPGDILTSSYATNPLGWGPYKVDQWITGDSIQLSRNPYYWQSNLPQVDNLIFKFYPDLAQAYQALLDGEVDVLTQDVAAGPVSTYLPDETAGKIRIYTSTGTVWEHIAFGIDPVDSRYVFFDDPEVRQAVTLCANRQEMIDTLFSGRSEIVHAYVPSVHPIYQASNATEWNYNLAQGREKLDAAGWVVGSGGWRYKAGQKFEVTLITTSGNEMREQTANIFKGNLAACGIDVTVQFLPASEVFADDGPVFGQKFDLALFAWLSGIEPSCSLFTTGNYTGYSNVTYDAACNAALGSLPGTSQHTSSHIQALEIWTQDVPAVPLYSRVKISLSGPDTFGLLPNPTVNSELWNVETWWNVQARLWLPAVFKN